MMKILKNLIKCIQEYSINDNTFSQMFRASLKKGDNIFQSVVLLKILGIFSIENFNFLDDLESMIS